DVLLGGRLRGVTPGCGTKFAVERAYPPVPVNCGSSAARAWAACPSAAARAAAACFSAGWFAHATRNAASSVRTRVGGLFAGGGGGGAWLAPTGKEGRRPARFRASAGRSAMPDDNNPPASVAATTANLQRRRDMVFFLIRSEAPRWDPVAPPRARDKGRRSRR